MDIRILHYFLIVAREGMAFYHPLRQSLYTCRQQRYTTCMHYLYTSAAFSS